MRYYTIILCTALIGSSPLRAALSRDQIANMPAPEVEKALPKEHPSAYYFFADRLFGAGKQDEALFWFYVGQLRYRFYLKAHPTLDPKGDPALFSVLSVTVGQTINQYAGTNVSTWAKEIDHALAWDAATANGFTSKEEFAPIYQANRLGLEKLREQVKGLPAVIREQSLAAASKHIHATMDIRKKSYASDQLFLDLLFAPGGVGTADGTFFRSAQRRELVDVKIVEPYSNDRAGEELWTVQHSEKESAAYVVRLTPDGSGGTYFAVSKKQ